MARLIYNMQPLLQVGDLRVSMDFYTNVLGFTVDGFFPEDGTPTWCGMHSGNARLMLSTFDDVDEPRLTGVIYMYPDDVDAAWARLKNAAPVVETLHLTPYGMREFSISDPDGYVISLGQNAEAPHEHHHPAA